MENVSVYIPFFYKIKRKKSVSENSLQALHSVFGDVLIRATELLENHKVFVYHLEDFSRKLIKLIGRREQYILFCDINFCHCDTFKNDVLEGHAIVCEHILAVKLAEICGNIKNVIVTDLQMKEMLDDVVKDLKIVL